MCLTVTITYNLYIVDYIPSPLIRFLTVLLLSSKNLTSQNQHAVIYFHADAKLENLLVHKIFCGISLQNTEL